MLIHGFRNSNSTWRTGRLHAAGNIYSISPDIINKFCLANNTSIYRTAVQPYTNVKFNKRILVIFRQIFIHSLCKFNHYCCMIWIRRWQTASSHISITNSFNLFNAKAFGTLIKATDQIVKGKNNFQSRMLAWSFSKVYDIWKKNCNICKIFTSRMNVIFQFVCNLFRKNGSKQLIRLFLFLSKFNSPFLYKIVKSDVFLLNWKFL